MKARCMEWRKKRRYHSGRQAKMLVLTCVSKNRKRGRNNGTDKMSRMWPDDF